ncbi:hypothetical protein SPRG_19767 [Saprolegnia parasitica CBS 223.65]|uniref:AB hydrolase-1 domain-containing protein n=1 Tax=Saprolegnia parasitica (strain CBS 223.65) TaxID=695850 RepID=A0A067CUM5_SAPPC|nr:hypothetical protein SPRG_19767 [Saprolegnia parasitica CBS 223.65]KDO30206.1 hypothetical protein SPRG_19767 [Saprolegnia parasitica CBS 223.65]|eukprot:XP_012199022.1 hypothetical protein SPRG_19767 [Saprolegnia parasitica CBS 223.65]
MAQRPPNPWNRQFDFKLDALDDYFAANKKTKPSQTVVPECAEVQVPLCHTGLCTSPKLIESFVKRIPASSSLRGKKALLLLQGGPGASSVNMEGLMANLYSLLDGQFSIYTLDHRGTGRSSLLDCEASQATAAGSPSGATVTIDELPSCLSDLNYQFGLDASAYSVSSAAADLNYILTMDPDLSTSDVFVYGVSYGTYLVERLMHFAPPNVRGYLLDSVQAETFPSSDANLAGYYSNWDRDYGQVATRFFSLCDADAFCASQIGPSSQAKLMALYEALDKNASACATLLSSSEPPSWTLRKIFAGLFMDMNNRALIPAIIKRLGRCNAEDVQVLSAALSVTATSPSTVSYVRGSDLLYNTIVFSEIWEPQTEAYLKELFAAEPIASGLYDGITPQYCLVIGSATGPICAGQAKAKTRGFKYTPIKGIWNTTAAIPANASVLILSGGLDPQTPAKYATLQFESMRGDQKKLVHFPFAAHGVINTTPMTSNGSLPCGYSVIASFLQEDGDVRAMDVSCVDGVAPMTFRVPTDVAQSTLLTSDAFDGAYDPSLAVAGKKASAVTALMNQSQVPLIVVSALFGLSMLVILALGLALRRQQARLQKGPSYEADTAP